MHQTSRVILVVDDEPFFLRGVTAILRRGGYSLLVATGALEALKKSREFSGEIHLLLTDVVMHGMDGPTLAEQILTERNQIRVLLMSGYPNAPSRLPFLKKPFRMHELLERVLTVIDGPSPPSPDTFTDRNDSRDNVLAALQMEINKTRSRYLEVSRGFLQTSADFAPDGIQASDGFLRLLRERDRYQAFNEYQRAREKLASYIASNRLLKL